MLTHNGNQVLTMSPEIILQFLDPGSEGPLKYPLDVCPFDRLSVCPFVCAFVQIFLQNCLQEFSGFFCTKLVSHQT